MERTQLGIVTREDLTMAIANRTGIDEEDALRDALFVLDTFGFDERIVDNVLEPEDRQLAYILEEEGLLTTEREETTLYDGREWRTHYWVLKVGAIQACSADERKERRRRKAQGSEAEVYNRLPPETWANRAV